MASEKAGTVALELCICTKEPVMTVVLHGLPFPLTVLSEKSNTFGNSLIIGLKF